MDFCFSIAFQCVEMNRGPANLNTRAGNEPAERRGDISTWMLIERLQYKHALGQNSWQHDNHDIAAVTSIEQFSGGLGMLFVILYEIANNQIGVDQPSLGHRTSSRPRASSAAASRICAKDIPLPFLLASVPFSDRVPGCTRMVAWSPFTIYSSLSPGLICRALRISPGIVVCPLLVTVECNMASSLLYISYLLCDYALLSIEWQTVYAFNPDTEVFALLDWGT